jgi:hypothetical protein
MIDAPSGLPSALQEATLFGVHTGVDDDDRALP